MSACSKTAIALLSGLILSGAALAQDQTLLLRDPAISKTKIAFIYAGDLWTANRDGSNPHRLTSSPVDETDPVFSPDGSWIAYTANHEDNEDVYIIPTAGGQPKRLTWHPGDDVVLDWTPDGSAVAFASRRETNHGRSAQLYHVSINGGLPEKQMKARIYRGRYDAAGKRFAYIAFGPAYNGLYGGSSGWHGYRGGTTPSVIVMDLEAGTTTGIPGERVNDIEPMWMDGKVYFISDRDNKIFNLFRFDPASGAIERISDETVWDIRAADARDGKIIYESGGHLKLLDTASGDVTEIRVSISPDLPQLRPQWKDASKTIETFDLSPSGKRVAITARGEVFTVPVKDGSTRDITRTDGAREYTALWSPDGERIAYIDASGPTQRLVIEDQRGLASPRRLTLGSDFYSLLEWGGDGKHIVYQNNHLQLFAMNLDTGRSALISTDARRDQMEVDTSPDGRWLAYTQEQANFNRDLRLYDFTGGRSYRVTNDLADTASPAFSADGTYLFFAASTNSGPTQVGLDMSSQERPYRASLYAVALAADGESPLKPKTGDEGVDDDKKGDEDKKNNKGDKGEAKPKPTRIDVAGIADRIVALPVTERNYSNLAVADDGTLYYVRNVQPGSFTTPPSEQTAEENELMRFKFDDRKEEKVLDGVTSASIAAKRKNIIVQMANGSLQTAEIGEKPEFKPLDVSGMKMMVDPRKEWAQIFDEAWRMEKAFFYDPNMHGLDWQAVYDRYRPLVDQVGRREDLNALMVEMIGEMQVGHDRTGGGDIHHEQGPGVGLLGVDLKLENGRHRITRIYTGESWNPFLEAPLAAPDLNVSAGDYILAVDGRTLGAGDNIFEYLQGTQKKQVTLRVASRPDGRDARNIVVEPANSERSIRLWAWVEDNRKAVEKATNGRVGYVYLPNTAGAGYTFFNRMFFAQVDKDAMIIDERSNGGGQAANYITDVLSRTYLAGWKDRDGLIYNTPGAAMYGPKVMMIDQDAGSGGDFLPYSFRQMKIGPLVGKRTWGGLIGISANPRLIDGGFLTVPFFRFFNPDYKWGVENQGVPPDVDVALDPIATNAGRDTQLERAIEVTMKRLETNPSRVPKKAPPYPTELGK